MTIFNQTHAIISPQFSKSFNNFQDDPLFQRICECVGVVHVQDGDGHKLLGSWESVKNAHDVLSAIVILKSLPENSNKTLTNQQEKFQEKLLSFSNDYEAVTPSVCASGNEKRIEIQKDSPGVHSMDVGRVTEINDSQDYKSDEILLGNYKKNPQFQEEMLKIEGFCDEDGNEVYFCDMCSYMSHRRYNLVIHRIRMHIRPYKCKRCSKGFGLPKDLKRHYEKKRNCVINGTDYKTNVWRGKEKLYFNPQSSPVNASNTRQENIDNLSSNVANGLNFTEADKELSKSLDYSLSKQYEDEFTKNVETEEQIAESEETVVNIKTEVADDDYDKLSVSIVPVQILPQIVSKIQSTLNTHQENINNLTNRLNVEEADKELSKSLDHSLSKQHEDELTKSVETEEQIADKEPEEMVVDVKTEVVGDDYDNLSKTTEKLLVSIVPVQVLPQTVWKTQSTSPALHSFQNPTLTHDVNNFSSTSVSENVSEVVLKCHMCTFMCSKRQYIEDHIKRVHCKKYECTICGSMFGIMKDLNRHYRRTHKMQIKFQRIRRPRRRAESGIMRTNDIDQC